MKKYYLLSLLLAISSMTWADGYEVSYTSGTTENVATITQSETGKKTWDEVLAEANAAFDGKVKKVRLIGDFSNVDLSGINSITIDLSEATIKSLKNNNVKYVVLPNGMSKEDVNSLTKGIGASIESAASAQGEYSYSDGYKYIDPNTHNEVIVNASGITTKTVEGVTYGLLTGTYTVIPTNVVSSFIDDKGTAYTVTATTPVLISKDGKAWGINSDVSLIPIFVDSYYTYNNGTEDTRYTGTLFRTENSVKYGNTGQSIALSSTSTGYTYSSDEKTYVYVGEDIYTNGGKQYVATSTPVSLTQKIEYHPYGPTNETVVNINAYKHISEPLYDENQKCSYVIATDDWGETKLYLVPAYYNGNEKYQGTVYTKNEEFFGGEFAEASVIEGTVYYATSDNALYTGKIYDGESLTGATGDDVALTSVIDYYTDEALSSLYEGPVTDDNQGNYKGVSTWKNDCFELTATYTYTYEDLAGVERKKTSDTRLNSITLEGDELYIALEPVQIASAEPTAVTLTAYVVKPGTLVYTLLNMSQLGSTYYDWLTNWYIDNENGYFKYQYSCKKVKKLILSGNLNAIDMNIGSPYIDKETGHYSTTSGNLVSYNALPDCKATYLDLTDALFGTGENYHPEDMTLSSNYSSTLETVLLPTDESQNTIPCDFLYLCNKVKELCIPYNYEIIEKRAFFNTHGLTHIYTTDPRNEDEDPDNNVTVDYKDGSFTFSANLKEIRSDANQSYPTFFGNAMQASVWDIYVLAVKAPKCGAYAFQGDLTFGNNGFAGNWTHPIQRSNYVNSGHVMCKLHYPSMSKKIGEEKNYTDVTKVYTLADETGVVDGYGQPLMWPRHEEFYRTFNQATSGYIWGAWKEKNESGVVISEIGTDNANLIDGTKTYNQKDYQGWHEFVLTENYNVRPFEPQKYYKEYDEKDWYTLCVPYDLTKSQLLQALGVKAGNKVKTLNGTDYEVTSKDVYPDVRTLVKVTRSLKSSKVIFTLSEKLLDDNGNVYDLELNGEGTEYMKIQQDGEDPVVIKGGYPYLVKSYWPKDDQIKKIGNYVMSVAESNEYKFNENCKFNDKYMLPTKEFKMIAINDDDDIVYKDAKKSTLAYYYFVGTYVQNSIPKFSYYLGKSKNGSHNFFRAVGDGIAWNIYSAIITPLSTLEYNLNSDASKDKITNIKLDVTDNTDDLVILAGESTASNAGKPLTFLLDENNGTVTGIKEISSSSCYADGRIYTLGGQFVGASFKGLPKGVYVKDGKKYVVK